MNKTELHSAIERAIGVVTYVSPISVAYTERVRAALLAMVPEGTSVDVYHRLRDLVVEARLGATRAKLVVPLV